MKTIIAIVFFIIYWFVSGEFIKLLLNTANDFTVILGFLWFILNCIVTVKLGIYALRKWSA